MAESFKIQGDYIELLQLLKATGIAQTGGHAKIIIQDGMVLRGGDVELRKRAKLRPGDTIQVGDQEINLE